MSQNDLKMWDISMDWSQGKSTGNHSFFPLNMGVSCILFFEYRIYNGTVSCAMVKRWDVPEREMGIFNAFARKFLCLS